MALTPLHPGAVRARGAGRQICLDANDRLYPRSPGLGPKFKGTKQIPVIGNRDRFLPDTIYLIEEFIQRSEEHTSELQSRGHLVCRLLLEQKNRHVSNT